MNRNPIFWKVIYLGFWGLVFFVIVAVLLRQGLTVWPYLALNSLCRPQWHHLTTSQPASVSWGQALKVCMHQHTSIEEILNEKSWSSVVGLGRSLSG